MERHVKELQAARHEDFQKSAKAAGKRAELEIPVMSEFFAMWKKITEDAKAAERAARAATYEERLQKKMQGRMTTTGGDAQMIPQLFKDKDLPKAEWRVQEEYRRRRRQWESYHNSSSRLALIFEIWKRMPRDNASNSGSNSQAVKSAEESAQENTGNWSSMGGRADNLWDWARRKDASPGDDTLPIGITLMRQVQGKELLAELRTMETLYETRIAACERLLTSMVMLHAAVKPLSRLWGLQYDMDRSESRLRVASTPAPVPFVEELPKKLPGDDASSVSSFSDYEYYSDEDQNQA